MAIFHFSAKIVSRGQGHSVTAAAAYRARASLYDERTGETHDYSRMQNRAVFTGLFAPQDAPAFAHDRAHFWNAVEQNEPRKDAQLARDFVVALPHEMTDQQRQWLVQDFVREQFQRHDYVADVAIHAPDATGDHRNHHAHILVAMRTLDADGFARTKDRSLNDAAYLQGLRASWARTTNRHLERHGIDARVDHRNFQEQGIDREPGLHLGKDATAAERQGRQTPRGERAEAVKTRNAEREQIRGTVKALEQEQQQPDRPLEDTAAAIFDARFASGHGRGFADALAAYGLVLAQVTPDEREALNQQRPATWRALEAGAYVVVNEQGCVYALHERNTGLTASDCADWLHDLDGRLPGVTETRASLFEHQHEAPAMPRGQEIMPDIGAAAGMAAGVAGNLLGGVVQGVLEPLVGALADFFTGGSSPPPPRAPQPQRPPAPAASPTVHDRLRALTPEVAARQPDIGERIRAGDIPNMPRELQEEIRRRAEEIEARRRERERDRSRER